MLRQNVWMILAVLGIVGSVSAQDGSKMESVVPAPSRDVVINPGKSRERNALRANLVETADAWLWGILRGCALRKRRLGATYGGVIPSGFHAPRL